MGPREPPRTPVILYHEKVGAHIPMGNRVQGRCGITRHDGNPRSRPHGYFPRGGREAYPSPPPCSGGENPNTFIPLPSEYRPENMASNNFWVGIFVGAIVMFLLFFLPVVGPLVGGLIAGLIARGGAWNGAKAGFGAGIIGAVLAAIIIFLGISVLGGIFHHALAGILIGFGAGVLLVGLSLYHAALGLVGGAVGAAIAKD